MRAVGLLVLVAACGFDHGVDSNPDDGGGSGSDDGGLPPGPDGACAMWSYAPTNFDPCVLPAPGTLHVTAATTVDTASTTLPKLAITQSDGSSLTVIHLATLTVDTGVTLTVAGNAVAFAVDGNADLGGTIAVAAGSDDDMQCAAVNRGEDGNDSTSAIGGAGGGGGGAAADNGGDGGNGAGMMAGQHGKHGTKLTSTLSPLRGGCRGGRGGRYNQAGAYADGGRGGGALQISTNAAITLTAGSMIDAAGRGGSGGPTGHIGGGGGGAGGGILLEGPTVQLDAGATLCADGGSGGEGGGSTATGNNGQPGACTGVGAAQTIFQGTYGGAGGRGSYSAMTGGGNASNSSGSDGAGGGGGGSVGWIRLISPNLSAVGAVITPTASS